MLQSGFRGLRRAVMAALVSSTTLSALLIGVTQEPAAAAVTSVHAEACTYMVNVGLFGGPQTVNGCGESAGTSGASLGARQPAGGTNLNPTDTSYSPHVRVTGSGGTMTASDSNGASAQYGPAVIHGGQWPCEEPGQDPNNDGYPGSCPASAPPSGPQEATATGSAAAGTASAEATIDLYDTPIVVPCYSGYGPTCVTHGGYGPFPVQGETLHVECSATQTSVTGSTTLTNSTVAHSTDGEGNPIDEEPVPNNPPVNYTEHGVITNVGDVFTVVYNEHIYNADGSLTVNAMHMYLYGPTAIGEVIRGSVTCGTNPGPSAPADDVDPTCGTPVVAPMGPEDPTPQVPRKELVGTFDAGRPHIRTVNDASTTTGTTTAAKTVTSATANFTAADVNAGVTGPNIRPNTHIVSVTNSTTAVLNNFSTATATNTSLTITRPSGIASVPENKILVTNGTVQVGADPGGAFNYTQLIPGQSGPLTVYATRTDEAEAANLPMTWQFDVIDVAGSTVTCYGAIPAEPPGPTTLAVNDLVLNEGNSGTTAATFTVTRYGNISGATNVTAKTTAATATAGSDFTALTGTLVSFAVGETSKTVTVNVSGDTAPENVETFTLNLSGATAGTVMGDAAGKATIRNDDGAAFLSVASLIVTEGGTGGTADFTVSRSGNITSTSTVTAKVGGGNATAGSDYTAVADQVLTFTAGQTSKTVSVNTIGDTTGEPNETFNLTLSGPSAGTILADAAGTAYIDDDDGTTAAPKPVFLAVNSVHQDEGSATFTVTRYGDTSGASTVSYKTGSGSATAGTDYTAVTSGTVSFAAAEFSKSVTINVVADTVPEKDETITLLLSGPPSNAVLGDSSGTATLLNDDGFSYLAVTNRFAAEGKNPYEVTVTRYGNTTSPATVKYKTGGGTATAGTDYTAVTGVDLNFGAGETTKTVTVDVNGDAAVEPNETFILTLTNPGVGVVLADAAGTATIVNDD